MYFLGLDVAKQSFQVVLLWAQKKRHKSFANPPAGFHALQQWLHQHCGDTPVHACLEATGSYSDALARFLAQHVQTVSLVNPARIKAFAQSQLQRTKTDRADAALIAPYAAQVQPPAWLPPPPEITTLQALVRHLDSLLDVRQQLRNRLTDGPQVAPVLASLRTIITELEAEIAQVEQQIHDHIAGHPDLQQTADLLDSIPGIGPLTAAKLLGEIEHLRAYTHKDQVVAYAGLNPRERQSGTSIKGKPHLSKTGNARVRKALYLPAVVALRHNPIIKQLGERLTARGLCKMAIIGAAMRKLLQLVYGVVKSGQLFAPDFAKTA
ncbi:MAG TPA: transposase [Blastocatellia bacterium]|nr:transposase [Blastocatellia bacterium]